MPRTLIGSTFAQYAVTEKLGEGGMGVVYKARDKKLGRIVALKVLPVAKVADAERKRRFMQEAKTASALNHQNIITIYEINHADGLDFIAMEYVAGQTLDRLVGSHGQPLRDALKYAVQIADALAVAHAAGVVHRDLKPANIMVSERGLVKVLDFGLAKLTEPTPADKSAITRAQESALTEEGAILGTVAYMSPEQAEGRKVDARSDIFSFGSVFYEMVTGRHPFKRSTRISTLTAILREEPPPVTAISREVPEDLQKIIARCLRKDPDRRVQTMSDLKVALEELATEPGKIPPRPRWLKPGYYIWAAAVVAVVAAALSRVPWPPLFGKPALPLMQAVPVTSFPGDEWDPAFSPDGNQIAFVWNGQHKDNSDIYIMEVGGATPFRVTTDPAADGWPAWSPDGREIAFVRQRDGKAAIVAISPLGGPERKLADGMIVGPVSWAPDAKHLGFSYRRTQQEPWSIYSMSLDTLERRRLTSPPADSLGDVGVAFAPDGSHLGFVRLTAGASRDVYIMPLPGGVPRRLSADTRSIGGISWTADSREIVFESTGVHGLGRLRRIPMAGGSSQPVQGVGEDAGAPSIAAKGDRLAYAKAFFDSQIHRIDLTGPDVPMRLSRRLIGSTRFEAAPWISPDGSRIALASARSGRAQIWTCNSNGTFSIQLTNLKADSVGSPSWSPDGQLIAFDSTLPGNADIFVISPQARQPRRVTTEPSEDVIPSWSRDGRWIYFSSNRSGNWGVWKIPADGGTAVQVTKSGTAAYESMDGKFVYFASQFEDAGIWRVPVEGGPEQLVLEGVPYWGAWTLTHRGIYFVKHDAKPRPSIEFLDFATQQVTRIAHFKEGLSGFPDGRGLSVSPDGKWLVYVGAVWGDSDIMMVDNFR